MYTNLSTWISIKKKEKRRVLSANKKSDKQQEKGTQAIFQRQVWEH